MDSQVLHAGATPEAMAAIEAVERRSEEREYSSPAGNVREACCNERIEYTVKQRETGTQVGFQC